MRVPEWTYARAGEDVRAGDAVTIENYVVYRKWWQFWKPREWTERRAFVIGSVHRREPDGSLKRIS